jgi:hypothetical protein
MWMGEKPMWREGTTPVDSASDPGKPEDFAAAKPILQAALRHGDAPRRSALGQQPAA